MKPADDLLFASVDLPLLDKHKAASDILNLDEKFSWWDNYRYTQMFPLVTKNGIGGKDGTLNNGADGEFVWCDYAPKEIRQWFDEVVFPWVGTRARVTALVTQPNVANHVHIDCNRNELNTLQHKFRIVLQGKTSTLYFLTKDGQVAAPDVDGTFLMDGGWVHGMTNTGTEPKVTIALGSPWTGNDSYDNIKMLLRRSDYSMPDNLEPYWNY